MDTTLLFPFLTAHATLLSSFGSPALGSQASLLPDPALIQTLSVFQGQTQRLTLFQSPLCLLHVTLMAHFLETCLQLGLCVSTQSVERGAENS